MKAVVIAAGKGTRLTHDSAPPKPLIPLLGVPLIERVVRTALDAGVEQVVIVVGHRAEELRDGLLTSLPITIASRLVFVHNDRFEEANGLSILAARGAVGTEDFLVLMSDHVVDAAILRRLIATPAPTRGALLAVDRRIRDCPDLDDATKVVIDPDGRITAIGKELTFHDAIDTGCFRMTAGIHEALETAVKDGRTSLTDGIRILAQSGRMAATEIEGTFWIDVDTPEAVRVAEKRLLASLGKGRDGPVSRLLNRPISLRITRLAARTRLSPNSATIIASAFGVAGALLLARGCFVTGGLMLHAHSVIDGVDGELARLKYRSSWFGGWCDRIGDMLGEYAIFLGIACGTGAWEWASAAILLNILAVGGGDTLTAMGLLLAPAWQPSRTILPRIAPWVGRDVMLFVLAILCVAGRPEFFFPYLIMTRGAYCALQSGLLGRAMATAGANPR